MIQPVIIPLVQRFLLGMITLFPSVIKGQDSLRTLMEDGYIEDMARWVSMDLSVNNSFEKFAVHPPNGPDIRLSPNTSLITRLNVNYQWLSVGVEFAPKFIPGNDDNDIKGSTDAFSLGTSLIFKHWWLEVNYSKVRGYYLENTQDFIGWKPGDPYFQFPDQFYQGIELISGYNSNSHFSFRSLTSQTERQLKSTGSFIPAVFLRYYQFVDKDSNPSLSHQRSNSFEGSLGPGYVYTFVLRENFYFSAGLLGSIGYLNAKITTDSNGEKIITNQDDLILRWQVRSGIGYNGDRLYGGAYGSFQGVQYEQENTTVMNTENRLFFHIFLGYRFTPFRFLKRSFDWMNDQMPN